MVLLFCKGENLYRNKSLTAAREELVRILGCEKKGLDEGSISIEVMALFIQTESLEWMEIYGEYSGINLYKSLV